MKKLLIFFVLLSILFLAGCVESEIPGKDDEDTKIPEVLPLEGFSDYKNIKRASFKSEYVDMILEKSNLKGYNQMTIIYADDEELVFLNSAGVYYRYKDDILEEHDIFDLANDDSIYTTGILGYDKEESLLYAIRSYAQVQGVTDIDQIMEYNMDTKTFRALPHDLGWDPRFVHADIDGYVIEAKDKTLVFDGNFELIKEYSDAVFLGSSTFEMDKDNVVMLIGETTDNQCKVTLYKGKSNSTVFLDDSCDSVERLNVYSSYVYFIINEKLYKFDAKTDTFSIVSLTTENETVKYVDGDRIYSANHVFALGLSNNGVTIFNKHMDISQSSNAMDAIQVGQDYYLAKKPNTDEYYIYDFENIENIKIEEEFSRSTVDYNYLILETLGCTVMRCQNIYKNGTELIFSDVMSFDAVDNDNVLYIQNRTDTSYDIMHTNFETNTTMKLMSLNYNNSSHINMYPIYALDNGLIIIKDDETRNYHLFDRTGTLIETVLYIGQYKNAIGWPQIYLLRENGDVISLDYFML